MTKNTTTSARMEIHPNGKATLSRHEMSEEEGLQIIKGCSNTYAVGEQNFESAMVGETVNGAGDVIWYCFSLDIRMSEAVLRQMFCERQIEDQTKDAEAFNIYKEEKTNGNDVPSH